MSMFGFYVEYDSFAAIDAQHFVQSCLIAVVGLLFSWLVSAIF
ncbi:hypothetical protein PBI_SCTP2_378 [Salicola phage SCTP-2]|nr:hypothetical protein PBI_SCTP2_378 [Salicola phage SCTP-2]